MRTNPSMLFGTIAVSTGSLSQEQLQFLLEEQARRAAEASPVPLGELCEKLSLLTPKQVRSVLEAQRAGKLNEEDMVLGALAVRNGFATRADIELALESQKKPENPDPRPMERLGEILLAMGILTHQKLKALLAVQARLRNDEGDLASDLDVETREIAVVTDASAAPAPSAGPVAWLIQDTYEGKGEVFPLGSKALIGRMVTHEIPVADMASSRHHARVDFDPLSGRHFLTDLESRNGTYVNGERITQPCLLKPGDGIRIGETVLRYAVGVATPVKAEPPPAEAAQPESPAPALGQTEPPSPGPEKPGALRRAARRTRDLGAAALRKAHGAVTKVAPSVHPERKYLAIAACAGMSATLLPWRRIAGEGAALGVRDAGAVTFLLFGVALVLLLLRPRGEPLSGRSLRAAVGLTSVAALVAIWRLVLFKLRPDVSVGIGVPVAIFAGLAMPLAVWFRRPPAAAPAVAVADAPSPPAPLPAAPAAGGNGAPPVARRLWVGMKGTTVRIARGTGRILRGVTGGGAREKARAGQRRDELLCQIGQIALRQEIEGPEVAPAEKADQAFEAAKKRLEALDQPAPAEEAQAASNERVRATAELKAAEIRRSRALQRLGRAIIDLNFALAGEEARIAEVRALDGKLQRSA